MVCLQNPLVSLPYPHGSQPITPLPPAVTSTATNTIPPPTTVKQKPSLAYKQNGDRG